MIGVSKVMLQVDIEKQYDDIIANYNNMMCEEVNYLNSLNNNKPTIEEIKEYEKILKRRLLSKAALPNNRIEYHGGKAVKK